MIHPSEKCLVFIPWENIPKPNDPFCKTLIQQIICASDPTANKELFNRFLTKILGQSISPMLSVGLLSSSEDEIVVGRRVPSNNHSQPQFLRIVAPSDENSSSSREPPQQIPLSSNLNNRMELNGFY